MHGRVYLLRCVSHHVHKYDHILAFGEKIRRVHRSHELHQSIGRPKKDVDARPIHSVLNNLEFDKFRLRIASNYMFLS